MVTEILRFRKIDSKTKLQTRTHSSLIMKNFLTEKINNTFCSTIASLLRQRHHRKTEIALVMSRTSRRALIDVSEMIDGKLYSTTDECRESH